MALVIGKSAYDHVSDLRNASKDARDVSRALQDLGFEVIDGYDLTQSEILSRAQTMQRRLSPNDGALFYFSGHGVQIGAENYIIPVDASGSTSEQVRGSSVSFQAILAEMEQRRIAISSYWTPAATILSSWKTAPGILLALPGARPKWTQAWDLSSPCHQPGNVAYDGQGDNNSFTEALLRHLHTAEDDLHEVMRKVISQPQIPQAPLVTPAPKPQVSSAYSYLVSGLDPKGDGFLALHSGTTSGARRRAKMTEGTRLELLGQRGVGFRVRTETGLRG